MPALLKTTQIQEPSSASVNLTLDANGNGTFAGTSVMSSPYTMRNKIINGAMVIDQRNAGASVATSSGNGAFTADRWQIIYDQINKFTAQQNSGGVTPPTGFTNYLGTVSSSAYTVGASETFNIRQYVEGFNTVDLAWGTASALTVTLSFWVRSSLSGTFGGAISGYSNTNSYPFTYTITSANTWEYKTITISGPTSGTWNTTNSGGVGVIFSLGTGSTLSGTAGTWSSSRFWSATGATSVVGTNGATFYITGVQLERGTVATPFEYRNYQQEFAMCQRYYQQQLNSASRWLPTMYQESLYLYGVIPLQTYMRAVPSTSIPATSAFDIWGVGAPTAIIADSATSERVVVRFTKSGLTNYYAYILSGSGTTYFTFSAEL